MNTFHAPQFGIILLGRRRSVQNDGVLDPPSGIGPQGLLLLVLGCTLQRYPTQKLQRRSSSVYLERQEITSGASGEISRSCICQTGTARHLSSPLGNSDNLRRSRLRSCHDIYTGSFSPSWKPGLNDQGALWHPPPSSPLRA